MTRDLVDATIEGEMTKIEERVGPPAYARGLTLPGRRENAVTLMALDQEATSASSSSGLDAVRRRSSEVLPPDAVITDRARLRTYECDGLTHYKVTPKLVVLPETAEQLATVIQACAHYRVPFVARGSGTGLSGGALPAENGILVVTSRMRGIKEARPADQRAIVEPGVINNDVTKAVDLWAITLLPIPRANRFALWAATLRRIPVEPTASSTASRQTMSCRSTW